MMNAQKKRTQNTLSSARPENTHARQQTRDANNSSVFIRTSNTPTTTVMTNNSSVCTESSVEMLVRKHQLRHGHHGQHQTAQVGKQTCSKEETMTTTKRKHLSTGTIMANTNNKRKRATCKTSSRQRRKHERARQTNRLLTNTITQKAHLRIVVTTKTITCFINSQTNHNNKVYRQHTRDLQNRRLPNARQLKNKCCSKPKRVSTTKITANTRTYMQSLPMKSNLRSLLVIDTASVQTQKTSHRETRPTTAQNKRRF